MPTVLKINLENSSQVFFAGQTISGNVCITSTYEEKCKEITVCFKGFSKVHWTERTTETKDGETHTKTVHYKSSETYYNTSCRVWGNGTESILPPGRHSFNFSFLLPNKIPASFESKIGQVRHTCTAKMDIPWGFDKISVHPYSVNCLYDLNTDPSAKIPIECNKHKTLCCFCCKSGPLSMVLRVPRSGYVPGEKIMVNAECSNKSTSTVDYTEANIHQVITFYAEGNRKVVDRIIAEVTKGCIDPGDDDIWSNMELLVPALPPTRLQYCNNIDIAYTFKFIMSPRGCHTDLIHEDSLIIGSIPLRESFGSFAQPAVSPNQPQPHASLPQPSPTYPGPAPTPYRGQPSAPGWGTDVQPYNPNYPPAPHADPPPSAPGWRADVNPQSYNPNYPPAPHAGNPPSAPGWGEDVNPQSYNPNYPPGPQAGQPPSAPVFPGIQQYPDLPPPSFNECMFGASKLDDDEDDGGSAFAPRYASYNLAFAPPYYESMAPPPDMGESTDPKRPLIT